MFCTEFLAVKISLVMSGTIQYEIATTIKDIGKGGGGGKLPYYYISIKMHATTMSIHVPLLLDYKLAQRK